MTLYLFLLSIVFVLGFVGVTSKPSPIYGGVGLIVSGAIGCGMVLLYGGSYLGLIVFLIYLGGMLVVFGYTTAMATEEYPDTWGSNKFVSGLMLVGLFMELAYMI
ncbi:NADH-quinone oxidoreductase subunit J [Salmonella enterica]|nr:NADH-quinone oxidoreductase subunit J [Salmonella enterica]